MASGHSQDASIGGTAPCCFRIEVPVTCFVFFNLATPMACGGYNLTPREARLSMSLGLKTRFQVLPLQRETSIKRGPGCPGARFCLPPPPPQPDSQLGVVSHGSSQRFQCSLEGDSFRSDALREVACRPGQWAAGFSHGPTGKMAVSEGNQQ